MQIRVRRVEYKEVEPLKGLYRQEANCQIIHDSILHREMADPYLILLNGRVAGYGGVWNQIDPGRLMEFYTLPHCRRFALPMFRELLAASGATHIQAQTNIPLMMLMLCDFAQNITVENVLFHDVAVTGLPNPGGVFRPASPEEREGNPGGAWVIESGGAIAAAGGFLCHYNPPYGDVYMGVAEPFRQRGYGSYIVQEIKRVCYQSGKKPAARCNAGNIASRRTLEKAGFLPCGRLLVGEVKGD